jgi:hypothetical protein
MTSNKIVFAMHGIILLVLTVFSATESTSQIIRKTSIKYFSYKLQGANFTTKQIVNGGTGFIFTYEEHDFLVTNYHVLTGKNASTGKKLENLADTCNAVIIWFRDDKIDTVKKVLVPIYDTFGVRLFSIYHADSEKLFDLAVLTLFPEQFPPGIKKYSITVKSIDTLTYNKSGLRVFISGFPRGTSEPTIKTAVTVKQPMRGNTVTPLIFFGDSTLQGMSGSPIWMAAPKARRVSLIGINALNPTFDIENPKIRGAGFYFKYAMALIEAMIRTNHINIDLHYPAQ